MSFGTATVCNDRPYSSSIISSLCVTMCVSLLAVRTQASCDILLYSHLGFSIILPSCSCFVQCLISFLLSHSCNYVMQVECNAFTLTIQTGLGARENQDAAYVPTLHLLLSYYKYYINKHLCRKKKLGSTSNIYVAHLCAVQFFHLFLIKVDLIISTR